MTANWVLAGLFSGVMLVLLGWLFVQYSNPDLQLYLADLRLC